ncbi:Fc.00g022970.m01.CDS01 [Cosmosporella sp. VM-42]
MAIMIGFGIILWLACILWGHGETHGSNSLGEELQARGCYAMHNKNKVVGRSSHYKARRFGGIDLELGRGNNDHENEGFDLNTDILQLVATRTDGCGLHPELTEGPYFRGSLVDGKHGALLFLDLQIFDSASCEPAEGVYVEIWHTNTTGVYSGVVAGGNGSGDDDPNNAFTTFNRGALKTAPHIHIMTHINSTIQGDDTIVSDHATYVGQLFFDQAIIDETEALPNYRDNSRSFIKNKDDILLQKALKSSDPVFSWTRLKEHENGVLAWIPLGVNMSNVQSPAIAGTFKPDPTA